MSLHLKNHKGGEVGWMKKVETNTDTCTPFWKKWCHTIHTTLSHFLSSCNNISRSSLHRYIKKYSGLLFTAHSSPLCWCVRVYSTPSLLIDTWLVSSWVKIIFETSGTTKSNRQTAMPTTKALKMIFIIFPMLSN